MQRLTFLLLATILVSACKRPAIPMLNANNLPSSFITIDAGKDYQLKTFKGALVKISAISFDVPGDIPIQFKMKALYWVKPAPIDTSPTAKFNGNGAALFKANCGNCHKASNPLSGPDLAGVRMRTPDRNWAYRFVNNVNSMSQTDPYAKQLIKRYGSRMTQFNLSYEVIKAILDYCDKLKNDYLVS